MQNILLKPAAGTTPMVLPATTAPAARDVTRSDVVNLFAHFGPVGAAASYHEIQADAAAGAAAARWPLVAEWLAEAPDLESGP